MNLNAKIIDSNNISIIIINDNSLQNPCEILQRYALEVIEYCISIFGFYPFKYLIIIPGATTVNGGFPVDKGIIKIHGINDMNSKSDDYWKWIIAHEVFHMYWGYYVYDKNRIFINSRLGWITLGLGLFFDKLYCDDNKIEIGFHDNQVKAFLKAKEEKKVIRFSLSEDEINELDYDYNTIVLHGGAYYEISNLSKAIGKENLIHICKIILEECGEKELGYDLLKEYISKYYNYEWKLDS